MLPRRGLGSLLDLQIRKASPKVHRVANSHPALKCRDGQKVLRAIVASEAMRGNSLGDKLRGSWRGRISET